jgi:hypothetical protein
MRAVMSDMMGNQEQPSFCIIWPASQETHHGKTIQGDLMQ